MKRWTWIGIAVAVAVVGTGAGESLAGRGGGGGGIPDADVSLLYSDSGFGTLYKGTNSGTVAVALSFPVLNAAFGPAGSTSMVFVSDVQGGPRAIYTTSDFSGGGLTRLAVTGGLNPSDPAWSTGPTPNGSQMIAFIGDTPAGRRLFVVSPTGTSLTQLTFDPGQNKKPSWNPANNSQLVAGLYIYNLGVDASGSLVVESIDDLDIERNFPQPWVWSFSRDGQYVLFNHIDAQGSYQELWRYGVATGTFTRLTSGSPRHATRPCHRNDGKVLFQAVGTHRKDDLYTMNIDGTDVARYPGGTTHHTSPACRP